MRKKFFRAGLASIALLASSMLIGTDHKNYNEKNSEERNSATIVQTSDMAYAERLSSRGFIECTAVIIDTGDKAIMIHAMPSYYRVMSDNYFPIHTDNIGKNLEDIARQENINLQGKRAIVCTKKGTNLDEVRTDLQRYGVEIESIEEYLPSYFIVGRDISYDAKSNKLEIK